jgi:hypothetical protein
MLVVTFPIVRTRGWRGRRGCVPRFPLGKPLNNFVISKSHTNSSSLLLSNHYPTSQNDKTRIQLAKGFLTVGITEVWRGPQAHTQRPAGGKPSSAALNVSVKEKAGRAQSCFASLDVSPSSKFIDDHTERDLFCFAHLIGFKSISRGSSVAMLNSLMISAIDALHV